MKEEFHSTPPLFGRRRFLQIIAVAGATGALWQLGLRPGTSPIRTARQGRILMGTQINLIVHGPDQDSCDVALDATFSRMEQLVALLSRFDADSELSQLNRTGKLDRPGRDIREVLLLADSLSGKTGGAFDVTVLPLLELYQARSRRKEFPADNEVRNMLALTDYRKISIREDAITLEKDGMAVTLDGIAKGYIVDQGVATLRERGFANVYVEAGGDLMVTGSKPGGQPWKIGITNPRPEQGDNFRTMGLINRAVATSGDYMQPFTADMSLHHIIDPRSGISPRELASATVTAPTVAEADGLATAAMVMGPAQSLALFETLPDCECLLIGKDLGEHRSQGFESSPPEASA